MGRYPVLRPAALLLVREVLSRNAGFGVWTLKIVNKLNFNITSYVNARTLALNVLHPQLGRLQIAGTRRRQLSIDICCQRPGCGRCR